LMERDRKPSYQGRKRGQEVLLKESVQKKWPVKDTSKL